MVINTSSLLSDCILAMRDFLVTNISDPLSTARPTGERFVMTSYPRRIVSYPIITVLGSVLGDKQLGQQSEIRRVDIELQVRIWARNEKEKNTIYDEVYNDVKANQFPFSTTGTWDNLGLQDFSLKSAVDLDEEGEEGCKSKIIKYGLFFITT